ncbi:MAG: protoheme IX farnesyltransferase [Ardenticatenaceae bacterium]|nr:heme o synthase [Anaerolineales bacterium]MCB8918004.1 protoheme IX farnesyltransferase [Ardenticatenaceae bacterium]
MSINTPKQKNPPQMPVNMIPAGATGEPMNWRAFLQMLVVLFKMRVVSLLLLAAVGGAFLGAQGWPGLGRLLLILVTGGMAASGAAALNQYIERHADVAMSRTRQRPLVTGMIPRPGIVIPIGIALILIPSLAVLPFNPALSFFLVFGAVIYVGIYTLWLKPRTLLNIVIGGAAGSAAVMSGGAAVQAWRDPAVIILALLVFLWTPSHFWSLAILYREDYRKAGVPMLPAHTSLSAAAWWVFLHTVAVGVATVGLMATPALGWVYAVPAGYVTFDLFRRNIQLIRQPDAAHARSFFIMSNIYLMVVLVAVCVGASLPW